MSGVLKVVGKVTVVLAASIILGYVEYRYNGGKPMRKVYKEVKDERLAAEVAKSMAQGKGIVIGKEDCKVE